ncbi:MAG: hypothetical protein CVU91_06010 [Firmicutes bacterium HGW-Firmicutes-16]|nr:MAG: hypothetical protein CVU91_06010 [Firmicutes bacterium HGW-Firmicutes-16]
MPATKQSKWLHEECTEYRKQTSKQISKELTAKRTAPAVTDAERKAPPSVELNYDGRCLHAKKALLNSKRGIER